MEFPGPEVPPEAEILSERVFPAGSVGNGQGVLLTQ
jgi:hypothetical protein